MVPESALSYYLSTFNFQLSTFSFACRGEALVAKAAASIPFNFSILNPYDQKENNTPHSGRKA